MAGFSSGSEWVRRALHAGSWYTDEQNRLTKQLEQFLKNASSSTKREGCVGVIAPHAGYSYSGPTAGYAYMHLQPEKIKRVFVLGPSHHYYLEKCALSAAKEYATPIGNIQVDQEVNEALRMSGFSFETMSRKVDEAEHSIEMHIPFIAHVMRGNTSYKIVPILIGNTDPKTEQEMGKLLAPYLGHPENFFVISSDFCHWGSRFRYQYYDKNDGEIYQSIEKLDKRGMDIIESKDVNQFNSYLRETGNTICGRHPIGVLLNAVKHSPLKFNIEFVKYAQSSQCKSQGDSSVSYASGVVTML